MGRRQGRKPPYEIMQHVGSGSPLPRSSVHRVRGGSVGLLGVAWGGIKAVGRRFTGFWYWIADFRGFSSFFDQSRGWRAAEVKLPWPVLVLLGIVGLAAMGLMFQIGHHVAGRSAPAVVASDKSAAPTLDAPTAAAIKPEQPAANTVVAMGTVPPGPEVAGSARTVLQSVESPGGGGGIALTDPRAVGRNYFILATVRPSEVEGVRELQKFLAERGLETFLDTVNNGRLRVLVDVTRGFTREELRNLEHAEHEQRIRSLGREWKKAQGGIGTDLRDIYRDRYDGPTQ